MKQANDKPYLILLLNNTMIKDEPRLRYAGIAKTEYMSGHDSPKFYISFQISKIAYV